MARTLGSSPREAAGRPAPCPTGRWPGSEVASGAAAPARYAGVRVGETLRGGDAFGMPGLGRSRGPLF